MAIRAVLLDGMGTLLRMEPPAPLLRGELARLGVTVEERDAAGAFAAEIAYYREHHLEGRDQSSLAELRNRCAAVLRDSLGLADLPLAQVREAMLASIRFEAFADAAPALAGLRSRGLALVVASNWDSSLPDVLERAGLREVLDGVVTSAEAGAAKPDPRLLEAALEVAGCEAANAVHVGDTPEADVAAARAAGVRPVLLSRDGAGGPDAIASLAELPSVI